MKNLFILFLTSLAFASCKDDASMLVIKDCTGTYLRYNTKNFDVCNEEDLVSFEHGAEVKAVFSHISTCENFQIGCAMPQNSEGIIHVDKISYK